MQRERKNDWDSLDSVGDGHLDDDNSSLSKYIANATKFDPQALALPLKHNSETKASRVAHPILNTQSRQPVVYIKVQDRTKDEPYYRLMF